MWIWLEAAARAEEPATVEVGGFVEAYGALNTNRPENGVTALRGFDARSGTFALSLAALEVGVDHPIARGRVALQAGPTALSYYAAEPTTPSGVGVASTSAGALHPVREAWTGARAPVLGGLSVDGGVFLSPVGYDAIAVKDNHAWSLSNLGVGLPFYFTGARATQDFGQGSAVTVGVVNGWNSVVDGNREPAVLAYASHAAADELRGQLLWLAGDEGTGGFRQLFDAWARGRIGPVVVFGGADAGFEPRDRGTRTWQAGQLGAEAWLTDSWSVTLRGDVFHEDGPDGLQGAIFWPTSLLGEVTASLGCRPTDGLLVRLEGRHDRAADPVFWRGAAARPTATDQTTVTLGISGAFSARVPTGSAP